MHHGCASISPCTIADYKIATYNKAYGNPPHPAGMAATATVLLPVPEHWDLHQHAKSTHLQHGHATVGATQRLLATKFWHPESTLAVQQMLAERPSCQLMKPPDPALPNLVPIIPPPPLIRWAIDHTFWNGSVLLAMVEYATGWIEAIVAPNKEWEHTLLLLTFVQHRFDASRELVSDRANKFSGDTATNWQRIHGTRMLPTSSMRPRGHGKVEKINGNLKKITVRKNKNHPATSLPELL
jgi:hypothetical protein